MQDTLLNPFVGASVSLTIPAAKSNNGFSKSTSAAGPPTSTENSATAATAGASATRIGAQVMQWQQKRNELKATSILHDEDDVWPLLQVDLGMILIF